MDIGPDESPLCERAAELEATRATLKVAVGGLATRYLPGLVGAIGLVMLLRWAPAVVRGLATAHDSWAPAALCYMLALWAVLLAAAVWWLGDLAWALRRWTRRGHDDRAARTERIMTTPMPTLAYLRSPVYVSCRLVTLPLWPMGGYYLGLHGWPAAAAYPMAGVLFVAVDLANVIGLRGEKTLWALRRFLQPTPRDTPEI